MPPMEMSVTFTGVCVNEIIPSINRSFVYKAKEGRYVRIIYYSLLVVWPLPLPSKKGNFRYILFSYISSLKIIGVMVHISKYHKLCYDWLNIYYILVYFLIILKTNEYVRVCVRTPGFTPGLWWGPCCSYLFIFCVVVCFVLFFYLLCC